MKKLILYLVLLIFIFNFIGIASAANFFTGSGNSFLESTFGKSTSSDYVNSYLGFSSEDSGLFSDFSSARMSSLDVSMCRDGTDFLLQVEPLSCTPAVVRSDLLEEQDVPVFCKIQAMKINPLIDVSYIQNINFGSFNNSKEIRSIKFYPKFSALWRNRLASDFSDPLEYQDLGYAVVVLKRTPNESAMPESVEGKLKVEMKYNLAEAFGIRDNVFYLPEMSDDVWQMNREKYGFWNSKGYLRAESTDEDSAIIGLYTDKFQTTLGDRTERDKVKYASFNLKVGESTNAIYLPGVDCLATLTMKLDALEIPATYAIIRVNSEYFQVKQGGTFLDGACTVQSLKPNGLIQEVKGSCKGDKKSESFTLSSYPQVDIEVNGIAKNLTVGEKLTSVKDSIGNNTIGAIYLSKMELKKSGLLGKTASDIKLTLAYVEGVNADSLSIENLKKAKGTISLTTDKTDWKKNFRGIDFTFVDLANGNSGDLDKTIEEYYSSANSDFDSITSNFREDVAPFNLKEKLSETSYVEKANLARYLGKTTDLKTVCNNFKSAYPDSEKYYLACEVGMNSANSGTAYKEMLIGGDMKDIVLMEIYQPVYEEYGAEVQIRKVNSQTAETIQLSKGKEENFSQEVEGVNYITLLDGLALNSASVKLSIAGTKRSGSNYTTTYSTTNLKLVQGEPVTSNGYEFLLINVNLKKQAKVSLKAGANRATSESNFSYKIGIEKRAIQLSPEKTQERIVNLNKTIEEWTKVNDGLGKVVQGLKTACLATGTVFTLKNLVENFDGKAIARQQVMKGSGGWNEKCADFKKIDASYVSVEDCLFSKSSEIDAQVNLYDDAIKAQNADIKLIETNNLQQSNILDGKAVNQTAFVKTYSSDVGTRIKNTNAVLYGTNGLPNFTLSNVNINASEYGKYYSLDDLRNIDLYSRILAQNPNDEIAKKNLYNEIYELNKNQAAFRQVDNMASKYGIDSSNVKIDLRNLSKQEITKKNTFSETGLSSSSLNLERTGNEIKNDDSVFIYSSNSKEYLIKYDNDGRVTGTYLIDNGALQPHGIANVADSNNPFNLIVSLQTKDKLQNSYLSPEIRYYEEGTYKGLPSIVPVDVKDGWYAYMDEGAYLPGQLQTYYESGTVNSFWLCNVGSNRIEEFNSISRDDSCTMINLRTSQTEFRVASLTAAEAESLVRDAVSSIRTASQLYKNGISDVTLGGRINSKIKVGAPEVNIPDVRCTDIMSPKECQILFNVCDPVLCPPSRCDFGGAYPVKDVIQSGIIGSLVLCAPNAQEGIIAPICLTGVQAGMDNWLTITKSYQDCLQQSLDTGETVGICDEVRSIYICEFFWRQAAPLTNMALPKIISALTGQSKRGGGEYMTFNSAWENFQSSYKYFTNFYASNSFKAFKLRSSEEVGGLLCKSYASVAYPSAAGLLDVLTQPDSPPQYTAKFDEIPLTTATNPPTSQYKVFYHIFAGKDRGAYFRVYLREGPTSSYYQDLQTGRLVASGYISKGEYKTETVDFTYPAGYKELCVNVNGQEECGFGEATTSFAYNYLEDAYINETVTNFNVQTEKDCVSGTASWYSLLNPNVQEGLNDLIDPQIYNEGIIRICANQNPGAGSDALVNLSNARWKDVGYCGDETMRCWLDTDSLDRVFKFATTQNQALAAIQNDTIAKLVASQGYMTDDQYKSFIDRLGNITDFQERINLISENLAKVYQDNKYSYLLLLRGKSYAELAKSLFVPKPISVLGIGLFADAESMDKLDMSNAFLFSGFFMNYGGNNYLVSAIGENVVAIYPYVLYASPGISKEADLTEISRGYVSPLSIEPNGEIINAIKKPYFVNAFEVSLENFSLIKTVSIRYYSPASNQEGVKQIDGIAVNDVVSAVTSTGTVYSRMDLNLKFEEGMIGAPVLDKNSKVLGVVISGNDEMTVVAPISLSYDSLFVGPLEYTDGGTDEIGTGETPAGGETTNEAQLNSLKINLIDSGILSSNLCFKYFNSSWHWSLNCKNVEETIKISPSDSPSGESFLLIDWILVNNSENIYHATTNSRLTTDGEKVVISSLDGKSYLDGIKTLTDLVTGPSTYYRSLESDSKEISFSRNMKTIVDRAGAITPIYFIYQNDGWDLGWYWTPNSNPDQGNVNDENSLSIIVNGYREYYQPGEWVSVPDLEYTGKLTGFRGLPLAGINQYLVKGLNKKNFEEGIALMFLNSKTYEEKIGIVRDDSSTCGKSILDNALSYVGNDTVRPFAEAKDNPCATFVTTVLTTTSCVQALSALSLENQQCQSIDYLISVFRDNPDLFVEIEDKTNLQKGDIVIFGLKSKGSDKTQHSSIFYGYNSDRSEVNVISDPGQDYLIQAGYYPLNDTEWYVSYAFRYVGGTSGDSNSAVSTIPQTLSAYESDANKALRVGNWNYSVALYLLECLAASYSYNAKYDDNEYISDFINKLYNEKLITLDEYNDIKGGALRIFNPRTPLLDIKTLLEEKKKLIDLSENNNSVSTEETIKISDENGNTKTEEITIPEKKIDTKPESSVDISVEEIVIPANSQIDVCEPLPIKTCTKVEPWEVLAEPQLSPISEIFKTALDKVIIEISIADNPTLLPLKEISVVLPETKVSTNDRGELAKSSFVFGEIFIYSKIDSKPIENLKVNINIPSLAVSTTRTTDSKGKIDLTDLVEKNPSIGDTGSIISSLSGIVNYASNTELSNGDGTRQCLCGADCDNYANWILRYSTEQNVDPLIAFSLLLQESGCISTAQSDSSSGLMQITCSIWKGKYGLSTDVETCKEYLKSNPEENIRIGISILRANYDSYANGKTFKSCGRGNIDYSGWDAALRAYNGWGCNSAYPDQDYFVDHVNNLYFQLKAQSSIIASNEDLSSQNDLAYTETSYSMFEEGGKYYADELGYDCSGNGGITGGVVDASGNVCIATSNRLPVYFETFGTTDAFVLKADRNFVQNILGTLASMFQNFEFVSGDPVLGFISMDTGNIIYDRTDLADSFLAKSSINETKLIREFRYSYEKKKVNAEVLAKIKKASITDLNNGFKNAHCGCKDEYECTDYAYFLDKYSKKYNIPYMVIFALILQETECNQELSSSSGAYGVTQIISDTFTDSCGSVIGSFEDVQGANNLGNNIHCGSRILKDKYSVFKNGIVESNIYQNNEAFKNIIDSCVATYPSYADYSSWQAAYRAYNGFGCGAGADLEYANKVNGYYDALINLG